MVVVGHAEKALQVGRRLPFGSGLVDDWGAVGVTVFFVLSGFLITRLFVQERRATGTLQPGSFYLRRAFRILPAYWLYIAVIAILARMHLVVASASSFARSLSFTTNYLDSHSWVLNHSWSLSVEEQFYLLWPVLLLIAGEKRARRAAQWLIVAIPVLRILTFYVTPGLRPSITSMFHLRADALMIGCWAALELELHHHSRVLASLRRPAAALGGAVYCVVVAAVVRRLPIINVAFGYTIEAFAACSVLLWAIENPRTRAGRVLNWAPLVRLGVVSYSLYLWQQLWLSHETMIAVWMVPLLVCGAVLSAELSYRLVEQPMLRLGRSYQAEGRSSRRSLVFAGIPGSAAVGSSVRAEAAGETTAGQR
jgi:peptidoglycan/LPS O-acetylase OafA/YrhL